MPPNALYELNNVMGSTIHNKLQGTVYDLDFDEDFTDNVENLKSMRERDRRRSSDSRHDLYRSIATVEHSQSPKFATTPSALAATQKSSRTSYQSPRDVRPAPVIHHEEILPVLVAAEPIVVNHVSPAPSIHTIVPPVLPGPVDMRTYNAFDTAASTTDAFNNSGLLDFTTGIADPTLPDIDEEFEKDFQSALKASTTKQTPPVVPIEPTPIPATDTPPAVQVVTDVQQPIPQMQQPQPPVQLEPVAPIVPPTPALIEPMPEDIPAEVPKHSLIKLKIKGPHARPENYTSTVITSLPATALDQTLQDYAPIRRMRKKELLRQYCTQENMYDTILPQQSEQIAHLPFVPTNSGGRGVGIPKAVDSMSSIPTRDDYKEYGGTLEKKRKAGMSRELRQLDVPYVGEAPERRRSICSNASNASSGADGGKRKTRTKQSVPMATPKLKIKIGGAEPVIEPAIADYSFGGSAEDRRVRPPKKRLANMVPSLEDLKRDSMNFRKQVMGEFDSADKVKKKDKVKTVKLKKKKKDKKHKLEIVSNQTPSTTPSATPKLIIRIGKRKSEEPLADAGGTESSTALLSMSLPITSSNEMPNKLPSAPIKLKIARNSMGGGYMMASSAVATTAGPSNIDSGEAKDGHQVTNCQVVLTAVTKTITSEVKLNKGDERLLMQGQYQNRIEQNHQAAGDANNPGNFQAFSDSNATTTTMTAMVQPPIMTAATTALTNSNTNGDEQNKANDQGATVQNVGPILPPLSKDCEVR